jgi:hypothetical protein
MKLQLNSKFWKELMTSFSCCFSLCREARWKYKLIMISDMCIISTLKISITLYFSGINSKIRMISVFTTLKKSFTQGFMGMFILSLYNTLHVNVERLIIYRHQTKL